MFCIAGAIRQKTKYRGPHKPKNWQQCQHSFKYSARYTAGIPIRWQISGFNCITTHLSAAGRTASFVFCRSLVQAKKNLRPASFPPVTSIRLVIVSGISWTSSSLIFHLIYRTIYGTFQLHRSRWWRYTPGEFKGGQSAYGRVISICHAAHPVGYKPFRVKAKCDRLFGRVPAPD